MTNGFPQAAFQQARQDFQARRFGAALAIARQLRAKLPADPLLTQFAAASAVNAGEPSAAVAMLKPLAHHDPANWVAARMLVRACAEAGDTACRDAEMSRVAALCLTGVTPPGFSHYCVEDIKPGPARSLLFGNTWCHLGHFMFISGGRFSAPAGG